MAEGGASGAYSGRPAFNLFLYVRTEQNDPPNNRSRYAWELQARNPTGSNLSYALDAFPFAVYIGGDAWSGSHNLDFRGGQAYITLASGFTSWFYHDGAGNLGFSFSASHGPASVFGSASLNGAMSGDSLIVPRVPSEPRNLRTTDVKPREFHVAWDAPADMGTAALIGYELWVARDANFTVGVESFDVGQNRTADIFGRSPATDYYVRTRARNGVGLGPFSATLKVRTLSGAWISNGGPWGSADVLISNGGPWAPADVLISNGGPWQPAG